MADDVSRRLYLQRHAKSSWDDPSIDDHDRPLAPRGEEAVSRLRRYVATTDIAPALVICSSARRTVMTWDGVHEAFPDGTPVVVEDGIYGASAGELLTRLQEVDDGTESVMIIGHNPGLEVLAAILIGAGDDDVRRQLATKFPTGALAELTFDTTWADLGPGSATLATFVTPRSLA